MSVSETIIEAVFRFAAKHFGALQVCWLCLVATFGMGWIVSTRYATAAEVAQLADELTELKGDAIAKRIFDYRVRQCDTPAEQRQEKRWLAEQLRIDIDKYTKVTGKAFFLPACSDL